MHQIKVGDKGVLNYVLALQEHFKENNAVEMVARGHAIDRLIQAVLIYENVFSTEPEKLTLSNEVHLDVIDNGFTSVMVMRIDRRD